MSNVNAVSVSQLKQAIAIREKIDSLNSELAHILSGHDGHATFGGKGGGKMSAVTRKRMAAAAKARWAKQRGATIEKPVKRGRKKMSAAGRAKIAAAAKARWAKARAAGKNSL